MTTLSQTSELAFACELVRILDSKRSIDYKPWMRVGLCLGRIADGKQKSELYKEWITFSKKCPQKFDEDHCQRIFVAGPRYELNIGSLCLWASQDNEKLYNAIRNKYYFFSKFKN